MKESVKKPWGNYGSKPSHFEVKRVASSWTCIGLDDDTNDESISNLIRSVNNKFAFHSSCKSKIRSVE